MDDQRGLAIALFSRGYVSWQGCRFEAARTDMHACVEHARLAGDRTIELTATITGAMAGVLGTATAMEILEEADRAEQEAATFPTLLPMTLAVRAHAEGMLGRFDEARAMVARATENSARSPGVRSLRTRGGVMAYRDVGRRPRRRRSARAGGPRVDAAARRHRARVHRCGRASVDLLPARTARRGSSTRDGVPRHRCERRRVQPVPLAGRRGGDLRT